MPLLEAAQMAHNLLLTVAVLTAALKQYSLVIIFHRVLLTELSFLLHSLLINPIFQAWPYIGGSSK